MGHAAAALCPPCGRPPAPKPPPTTNAASHRPSTSLRPSSGSAQLRPVPTAHIHLSPAGLLTPEPRRDQWGPQSSLEARGWGRPPGRQAPTQRGPHTPRVPRAREQRHRCWRLEEQPRAPDTTGQEDSSRWWVGGFRNGVQWAWAPEPEAPQTASRELHLHLVQGQAEGFRL